MIDWITSFLDSGGAWAIAALMLLENIFPPIPSELIMPLAGFNSARGGTPLWLTILSGSAGSLAGAWFWYLLGRAFGADRMRKIIARHGRWLTMTPREFDYAQYWFDKHGNKVVLFGRLIPTVRTLISIPAGIAQMPPPRFLLFSAMGSISWCGFLAVAGYLLEDSYEHVSAWVNPVSTLVVVVIVVTYLWRVIRWRPDQ